MVDQKQRPLWVRIAIVLALGGAAYLTNLLPLPLSFGLHFLFGGVFSVLAAILYGPWAGAVTALLSAIPTIALWGHPFALLSMTLEAWVIGWQAQRGQAYPTVIDLVYWLVLGGPLVILTYGLGAHIPLTATVVAALKQAVNGLVYTAMASVLVLVWWQRRRRPLPLQTFLSNLIIFLVLVPLAFILGWMSRNIGDQLRAQLSGEAVRAGEVVRVEMMQQFALQQTALRTVGLGRQVLQPAGFTAVWLLSADGQLLAQAPEQAGPVPVLEPGKLGWVQGQGATGRTLLMAEDVTEAQSGAHLRAIGVLDLDWLARRVMETVRTLGMEVVVTDPTKRVVLSSWAGVEAGGEFASTLGESTFFDLVTRADGVRSLAGANAELSPDTTSLVQAERLAFVHQVNVPDWNWHVYVRKPLGTVEYALYEAYMGSFLTALILIAFLLGAVRYLAYLVTRPLVELAAISVSPQGEILNLPSHQAVLVKEVGAVTETLEEVGGRIRGLVDSLQETQRELQRHNVELAVANVHLADEAMREAVTGLWNQRAFWQQVQLWVEQNHPFTLVLTDCWGVKGLIDEQGRPSEADMKRIAQELQQHAALHGGEVYQFDPARFAFLFPETSDWLVERMLGSLPTVAASRLRDGDLGLRVGAARFPEEGETGPALLALANERLGR